MSNPNPPLENLEKGKWKKGQSGNPKGRPPKLVDEVLSEIQAKGYKPLHKTQLIDTYNYLLTLPHVELDRIGRSEKTPMYIRIMVRAMMGKKGVEIIEKMLDRAQGKPTQYQHTDVTTGGDKLEAASAVVDIANDLKKLLTPEPQNESKPKDPNGAGQADSPTIS